MMQVAGPEIATSPKPPSHRPQTISIEITVALATPRFRLSTIAFSLFFLFA
jgi:hypothetical protein